MRAMVYRGPYKVRVEENEIPRIGHPNDAIVRVSLAAICGSCYFCARGLYSNCHNVNPNATAVGGIYGCSHICGGYDGGQAEFVRVPFAAASRQPGHRGRRAQRVLPPRRLLALWQETGRPGAPLDRSDHRWRAVDAGRRPGLRRAQGAGQTPPGLSRSITSSGRSSEALGASS
jgi:hypothetical protein